MPNSDYIEQMIRNGAPRAHIEQMIRVNEEMIRISEQMIKDGSSRDFVERYMRGDIPNTPPTIDEATRPRVLEDPVTGNRYVKFPNSDGSFEIKPYRSGIYDLPQELPVNYPVTSSIGTENGSVGSNIHELPVNYPATSSLDTENGSVPSNLHELPAHYNPPQELPVNYPHTSSIGVENGSINSTGLANTSHNDVNSSLSSLNSNNTTESTTTTGIASNGPVSTIQGSNNTSVRAVDGSSSTLQSREVVQHRFNANDYPNNRHLSNSNISQIGTNTNNNYQHETSKNGILDKILSGIKSLDNKDSELNKSLKRRFYWNIWEKHKGRYTSYNDFKFNWDTRTDIWKQLRKESISAVKTEFKNALELNTQGDRRINRSVTREAQNLLNRSRRNRR